MPDLTSFGSLEQLGVARAPRTAGLQVSVRCARDEQRCHGVHWAAAVQL